MGKNKQKKKYMDIDLWERTKRDEVILTNVDINNKSDLKQIPVEKQNEHKTLIKDGIKMSENNKMDDSNKKNKGKNNSGLRNAEIETKLDDKKVELDVPKSSFSEKNEKKSIDNGSNKMKGNHKKLMNPASNDNFENNGKALHENILEAISSDSKNTVKPIHEENNKRNKKKKRGEDKNDVTQSFDNSNEMNSEKNNEIEKKKTKTINEFDQQNLSRPNDIKTSYETTKSFAIENKNFYNEKYDTRNRENKNIDKNDYDYNRSEKTPFIQKTKSESLKKINCGSAIMDQNTRASRSTNHNAYINHSNRTKSANRNKSHSGMSNTDNNGINSRHSKDQYTRTDRSSYRNEKHVVDEDHYSQKDKNSDNINIKSQKGKSNKYRKEEQPITKDENSVLVEIDADLFHLSKDTPLAHCVAQDLRMGAGIAVEFKRYFKGVGSLVDQKLTVGDVGMVKRHEQLAFYLVTKKISSGKPTMLTMKMALLSLLQMMKELNLTKLGIPKIGCGLDGLDWDAVKELITDVFAGSDIHITVCIPSKILDRKQSPSLTVYITPKNVWEMEKQTDIILLIDLDQFNKNNWINHVEANVNARYPFMNYLLNDKSEKMNPGDVKQYCIKNENIICVFTSQTAYYSNLEKAFENIKKAIKDKDYRYFAFQSGPIGQGENFKHISWTVLILRSIINNCELWLCGDTDQSEEKVIYDQFCRSVLSNSFRNYSSSFNSPA